jgi:hypothetical protein
MFFVPPRKMKSLLLLLTAVCCFGSTAGAADFVVVNTNNQGPGSLYQAITDANANAGTDNIVFNIPGPGVHVIDVSSGGLPEIKDPVILDGYTQPGARPNTLSAGDDAVILIQIDNTQRSTSVSTGLVVSAGTSNVRGLSITGFGNYGISLIGPGASNIIEGNFIGLAPDGVTAMANNTGIELGTPGNMIGGTTPAARNVVAGQNSYVGIEIQRQPNTVAGNYIGTNASGTYALAHFFGIQVLQVATPGVVIGGTNPGAGNLISGTYSGIKVGYTGSFLGRYFEAPANGVEITGNLIGLTSDGQTPLGNNQTGVQILVSSNTTVGGLGSGAGNRIAFNGGVGVAVSDPKSVNNRILSNSIYGRGLRIALGADAPHPNDALDADNGENHLQNFPVITGTSFSGRVMAINGVLNSAPNTQFTIQIFSDGDDYLHPSQNLLGTVNAVTDNNGKAEFLLGVNLDDVHGPIDATATDPAGNTSEFFLRPSHFRNLSTRARVQTGDAVMIGGFIPVVLSSAPSEVVVRALGPSLSSGGTPLAGRLDDPILEVYQNGQLIASNDNWQEDSRVVTEVQKYGLAPGHASEAAAVIYPVAGAQYTAIVRGKNNSSGIALVEFYDVTGTQSRPVNLSTRGLVQGGDNVMIGGTILQDGNGPTRVVIRALGPSLANLGIAKPLPDPVLELRNADGALIAINDDWKEDHEAEITFVGLAPTNPAESAIFISLEPGAYTTILRGKENSTGLALIEFYQLP